MNSRVKLTLTLVACVLMVHFILSNYSSLPDYNLFSYFEPAGATEEFSAVTDARTQSTSVAVTRIIASNNDTVLPEGNSSVVGFPTKKSDQLELCPLVPPNLVGPIKVWEESPPFDELAKLYKSLEPGGHGFPRNCQARHRVAIIIPYRDREEHLRILLRNLLSLFIKQQLDFGIFVVEQKQNETFNRAKLMNVGFAEAAKIYDWQCFIFHDVDLLPENDRNMYSCPSQPRHMSVAIDKFKYRLPYGSIFGGVAALTKAQFEKINGFSNDYWGWGGEDDDLSARVRIGGYKIVRYPSKIARYKMIKHSSNRKNPINKCRYKLMYKTKSRWQKDGLSSLKYKIIKITKNPLYTNIEVSLLEKESREALHQAGFKNC